MKTIIKPMTAPIFLIILGIIYLLIFAARYTLVMTNIGGLVINGAIGAAVLWLVRRSIKNRETQSPAAGYIAAGAPVAAVFFVMIKRFAVDMDSSIYAGLSYVVLIAAMVVLFYCTRGLMLKAYAAVASGLLFIPVFLMLAFMVSIPETYRVVEAFSVSGLRYEARIIQNSRDGGHTGVYVVRRFRDFDFGIGELRMQSVQVYSTDWWRAHYMTARWHESSDVLHIYFRGELIATYGKIGSGQWARLLF